MIKEVTEAVVTNVNAMEAEVTPSTSGNVRGAAVSRDASPLTVQAGTTGSRIHFRLSNPTEQ
jgi:hypothetical protein